MNRNIKVAIQFLFFILFSWVLVHVVAICGIFVAASYPIWWLFFPKQTICFICRSKKEGEWCQLCRKTVRKSDGLIPKNILSSFLNGLLILLFSITSVLVVFGESQLLFKLRLSTSTKTVSIVIPSKGAHKLGEVFPMQITIEGMKTPINAVQTDVKFDQRKLEVVDVSTVGSFATIFIQKEINNQMGYVRLTGGLPNPGFSGEKGTFGTIYFRGKLPGFVQIDFLPTSLVLANDGEGSNILKDFNSVSYLILPGEASTPAESPQKTATVSSSVLGATTQSTQMTFYEEDKVLGSATTQQQTTTLPAQKGPEPPHFIFFEFLARIDQFILSLYTKVLNLFFGKSR